MMILDQETGEIFDLTSSEILKIEYNAGYVVMKDGTIRCSLEANMNVAAFDGCLESEMLNDIYNNVTYPNQY